MGGFNVGWLIKLLNWPKEVILFTWAFVAGFITMGLLSDWRSMSLLDIIIMILMLCWSCYAFTWNWKNDYPHWKEKGQRP